MKYLTFRRAKFKALCGWVNLPRGTHVEEKDGTLFVDGKPLCFSTSQNAYDYFARDDDGFGLERGKLTSGIIARLAPRDENYQKRWDRIWDSPVCQKYKRYDEDYWLWNHQFYNAPIMELRHIAKLIEREQV